MESKYKIGDTVEFEIEYKKVGKQVAKIFSVERNGFTFCYFLTDEKDGVHVANEEEIIGLVAQKEMTDEQKKQFDEMQRFLSAMFIKLVIIAHLEDPNSVLVKDKSVYQFMKPKGFYFKYFWKGVPMAAVLTDDNDDLLLFHRKKRKGEKEEYLEVVQLRNQKKLHLAIRKFRKGVL